MNYKELAELLYPEVTTTIEDLEKMYPERNLPEGAEVCRFAPSPTGRMHMGNMYAAFIPEVFENREQIEISRYYEKLPKPTLIAAKEYEDGKVYYKNPAKEKNNL